MFWKASLYGWHWSLPSALGHLGLAYPLSFLCWQQGEKPSVIALFPLGRADQLFAQSKKQKVHISLPDVEVSSVTFGVFLQIHVAFFLIRIRFSNSQIMLKMLCWLQGYTEFLLRAFWVASKAPFSYCCPPQRSSSVSGDPQDHW